MTSRRWMRCVAVAIALACFSHGVVTAGAADTDLEWQFTERTEPENEGRMTARLVYGVPETDDVRVRGVCEARRGTAVGSSQLFFSADVGPLSNGATAKVRFSGGGFDHALEGEVKLPTGEEGSAGVSVAVPNDDPLWTAFASKDQIDYLVPGFRAATLSLTRGRDKISRFIDACRAKEKNLGTATVTAGGGPVRSAQSTGAGGSDEKQAFESAKELGTRDAWDAFLRNYPQGFHADLARAYLKKLDATATSSEPEIPIAPPFVDDGTCRERTRIRARNSDTATKITFINASGATRGIVWVDYDGNPKDFATLEHRQKIVFDTFLTHPWMVTDGPGNCIQITLPTAEARTVVLGPVAEPRPAEAQQVRTPPPKKPETKKVTGCEEGFKLVKGRCKRIKSGEKPGGCPPGTVPVPETDDCKWKTDKKGFEVAPWKKPGCKTWQSQCAKGNGAACGNYEANCQVN
ncbi:MAG: VHL beta domain-containing protein [Hyphomicrobium sp.]